MSKQDEARIYWDVMQRQGRTYAERVHEQRTIAEAQVAIMTSMGELGYSQTEVLAYLRATEAPVPTLDQMIELWDRGEQA